MPDLRSVFNPCSNLLPVVVEPRESIDSLCLNTAAGSETLDEDGGWCYRWDRRLRNPILHRGEVSESKSRITVLKRKRLDQGVVLERCKKATASKLLEDHVRVWVEKKVQSGVPEKECFLPFLSNAPRQVECRLCNKVIYPKEEVLCTIHGCQESYHIICVKERLRLSAFRSFKCPQHVCFICKQKGYWRCIRCTIAAHSKCSPWPEEVIFPTNQPRQAVCWRHSTDWRLEKKRDDPTTDVEEAFRRFPLPYIEEEFNIDLVRRDVMENKMEPTPFIQIKRNLYLVKKKRDDVDAGVGCTNCVSNTCSEDCECRVQSISCSKACNCSETCTNRPFRKEKKVKIVKTQFCGWGVEAAESIRKGDFVIEYIGEVIDDALCEQRLWDMKHRGDHNFYMCEIRKDFTIDATFKGNAARFLNHSCDPNCNLEKWQVDGETRVGVFASRMVEAGESLTYDYRFVHFGDKVECFCGASNCQGYLGIKRKIDKASTFWGCKRKRTMVCMVSPHK